MEMNALGLKRLVIIIYPWSLSKWRIDHMQDLVVLSSLLSSISGSYVSLEKKVNWFLSVGKESKFSGWEGKLELNYQTFS